MTGLASLARVPLATLPTPLQQASTLSEELGVDIWFKRDDLTGMGLGGNKVRGLEYLIADAYEHDCDCLVTGAGPQSNWAMLAALAARRFGLDPYLVCYGRPVPETGNRRLHRLIGVDVRFTGDPDRTSVDAGIERLADRLRGQGRRPYVLPRGGATPLGSIGYVRAALELAEQLVAARLRPTQLWLATGSCGTQAGLLAAARWLAPPYQVIGVTVSRPVTECVNRIGDLADRTARLAGLPGGVRPPEVVGGYLGPGYGVASSEGDQAAELVARTEGVLLDPVFGAKAMAALIDSVGTVDGAVVFLVSGGAPTLFAGAKGAM